MAFYPLLIAPGMTAIAWDATGKIRHLLISHTASDAAGVMDRTSENMPAPVSWQGPEDISLKPRWSSRPIG